MIPKCLTVLWIDYRRARLFRVDRRETLETSTVISNAIEQADDNPAVALSNKAVRQRLGSFFEDVALQLKDQETILVMGPGRAKEEFMDYLERHPDIREKVIAVEAVEESGDEHIIHQARKYMQ